VRRLRDYALREWLSADPLRHGARRARNYAILQSYKRRRIDRQAELIAALRPGAEGKTAVFTVAFNNHRTIAWLADGFLRHGRGALLVVCDNSPAESERRMIAAACHAREVAYVPLPRPPLARLLLTNPPLSHGMALSWIFYNLVRPLAPRVFAFIDHDLIPLSPFDLGDRLGDRPVYGLKSNRQDFGTWSLWAGYSVFDFAAVGALPLDFTTDAPLHLDTGGQNWMRLYRYIRPETLRFAEHRSRRVQLDGGDVPVSVEMVDEWLHIGGISYRDDAGARLDTAERVLAHLGELPPSQAGGGGSSMPHAGSVTQ
jgi:hypothetical protein